MVRILGKSCFSLGGFEPKTTNNRMELMGFLQALLDIQGYIDNGYEDCGDDCFEICTDSAYIHNCFKQKWYESWEKNGWKNSKKEPVANQDLWKQILAAIREIGMYRLTFTKVKGHDGNKFNEMADKIAVKCKDTQKDLTECSVLEGE